MFGHQSVEVDSRSRGRDAFEGAVSFMFCSAARPDTVGGMARRTNTRWIWAGVTVAAIVAFLYLSESAMTWLRVTLHGR